MSEQATDRENLLRMIQGGDGRRFPFVERVHLRADATHPEGTAYIVHNGGKTPQGKLWEREHLCADLEEAKMILDIILYGDDSPLSPEQRQEGVEAAVRVSLFDDGRFIDRNYKGRTL